jgi:hypothetical protein
MKPLSTVVAHINIITQQVKNGGILAVGAGAYRAPSLSQIANGLFRLLFLLFLSATAFGTTVVVLINSGQIVAAFDSKVQFVDRPAEVMCKIDRIENLFWLKTGINLDDRGVIERAYRRGRSIIETNRILGETMPASIQSSLREFERLQPNEYRLFMTRPKKTVGITLFGMENHIPVVAAIAFAITEIKGGEISIQMTRQESSDGIKCCGGDPGRAHLFVDGYFDAIIADTNRNPRWGNDFVSDAKRFLQLEIDESPVAVGPPIRIMKIDSKGPRWVQNSEGCDTGNIPKEPIPNPAAGLRR